jgi:uncharacterized protein (TIGR03437 family)
LTTSSNPAVGGTVTPATTFFAANSVVTVQAVANPDFSFAGWIGTVASTNSATTTVTMSSPRTIVGQFSHVKSNQSIDFPVIPDKTFGDPPFGVTATASSGLLVTLSIISGPATISGSIITLTGTGSVVVRAAQSGDSNYLEASPVDRAFRVLLPRFSLALTTNPTQGGTISASPAPAAGTYASGTPVQIQAQSSSGFIFTGFSGDLSGITNPQSVVMSQSRGVTANFAAISNDPKDQMIFGVLTGNPLPSTNPVPLSAETGFELDHRNAVQKVPRLAGAGVPSVQVIPGTGGNWLTADMAPAANPSSVQLSLNSAVVTSLATGTYVSYVLVVTSTGQRVLTVKLLVNVVAISGVVDSAAYQSHAAASEELFTAFGLNEATHTLKADSLPLGTSLGGTSVTITDSAGSTRPALLLYVSPTQVNFLTPAGLAFGPGTLTLTNEANQKSTTAVQIGSVSPGLFSADQTGHGVAAAGVLRVAENGTSSTALTASCGATSGECSAVPIDLSNPSDQVYLSLYGTGIRGRSALSQVVVTIAGVPVEVLYAGTQSQYPGLDQVNVKLPASLAGKGDITISISVDGQAANVVRLVLR